MLNVFQKEAEEKWGHTQAFQQSSERTKRFTKEDWEQIRSEQEQNMQHLVRLMVEGLQVSDPRVQQEITSHRGIIHKFYDCTDEMYRGLAEMYVADERFAEHYRVYHQALPEFLSNAMLESIKA